MKSKVTSLLELEHAASDYFESLVNEYADRVAVESDSQSLTYYELNNLANQIGQHIYSRLGGEQTRVAVLVSTDTLRAATFLAVLKSRKTYVPLEAKHPTSYLKRAIEDCQSPLIICDTQLATLAAKLATISHNAPSILLLEDLDPSRSTPNLGLEIRPEEHAYIVYTSGTTGSGKGVIQTHRNLLHRVENELEDQSLKDGDRVVHLGSPAFSSAIGSLFRNLAFGATICQYDWHNFGFSRLFDWLNTHEITVFHSTASLLRNFLLVLKDDECLEGIRLIRVGSEPVYKHDLELARKRFPNSLFRTGMGSTETGSICRLVIDRDMEIVEDVLPIGYPYPNKEVLILNPDGQRLGEYQVGEIAVQSRYLTPGYWQNPELTNAKFLKQHEHDSAPIFLTGDLGYRRSDGCLAHTGRKDFMVKIRGFRVELAAVELAFRQISGVKDAAVITKEVVGGENGLAAFIVTDTTNAPSDLNLRSTLSQILPDYMIPSTILRLDALPLTANGKLDRMALATLPGTASIPNPGTFERSPSSALEALITGIWADVLKLDQIGIDDNFLDLGGNSILAARILARVNQALGVDVPFRLLADSGTPAILSAAIEAESARMMSDAELSSMLDALDNMTDAQIQGMNPEISSP